MVRDVASSRNLRLIDVNKAWIAWIAENPGKFDLMVPDGIHPNENGCREIVLPAVLEGLRL
jgi:lysophospholipase L1-like esterase